VGAGLGVGERPVEELVDVVARAPELAQGGVGVGHESLDELGVDAPPADHRHGHAELTDACLEQGDLRRGVRAERCAGPSSARVGPAPAFRVLG
jgi:hypothetical protein